MATTKTFTTNRQQLLRWSSERDYAGAPLDGQALAYAAEAFKVVEQGRARSLLDMLGESGADITAGVPADLLARKQANLDRQQEIAQALTGVAVGEGDEKPADTGKLEEELETLGTEYDNIENQIRASSPKYAALTAPQPLTPRRSSAESPRR